MRQRIVAFSAFAFGLACGATLWALVIVLLFGSE